MIMVQLSMALKHSAIFASSISSVGDVLGGIDAEGTGAGAVVDAVDIVDIVGTGAATGARAGDGAATGAGTGAGARLAAGADAGADSDAGADANAGTTADAGAGDGAATGSSAGADAGTTTGTGAGSGAGAGAGIGAGASTGAVGTGGAGGDMDFGWGSTAGCVLAGVRLGRGMTGGADAVAVAGMIDSGGLGVSGRAADTGFFALTLDGCRFDMTGVDTDARIVDFDWVSMFVPAVDDSLADAGLGGSDFDSVGVVLETLLIS